MRQAQSLQLCRRLAFSSPTSTAVITTSSSSLSSYCSWPILSCYDHRWWKSQQQQKKRHGRAEVVPQQRLSVIRLWNINQHRCSIVGGGGSHERRQHNHCSKQQAIAQVDDNGTVDNNDNINNNRNSNSSSSSWQSMVQQLQDFVRTYGHARVPEHWQSNPSLARWVAYQRSKYKAQTLTRAQQDELERLGMIWNPYQVDWDERFEQYVQMRNNQQQTQDYSNGTKNKSASTSSSSQQEQEEEEQRQLLSRWMVGQRYQYRLYVQGKPSHMTEERIRRLNEVNFEWEPQDATWKGHYHNLVRFHQDHGHCSVPPDYAELYRWVEMNRYQYKKFMDGRRPCSMTAKRIQLLQDLDFVWDAREAAWLQRWRELKEYIHVSGTPLGQMPPIKTHSSLWHWLRRQQKLHDEKKRGRQVSLTDERIAKLQQLGFLLD